MIGGIYEIRNRVSGKYYVGRAQNFDTRFKRHRYELRNGRHHCLYLQRACTKCGEDTFEFVVVIECPVDEATRLEQERLNSGGSQMYNVSRTSTGGDFLTNHLDRDDILFRRAESSKEHMASLDSETRIRLYVSPDEKNGMYGRKHTEDSRRKMSETTLLNMKQGTEHPNFGIKRSKETRLKMSKIASSRTGEKNFFYGKAHSKTTKEKLAVGRRGKLPTNIRPVLVDGILYPSVTEAARQLGVTPALVIY